MSIGGNNSHQQRMLSLLRDHETHNITIEVTDLDEQTHRVSCARFILAELSESFKAMLRNGQFLESTSAVVQIGVPMSRGTLEALVYFAYMGCIDPELLCKDCRLAQERERELNILIELLALSEQWQIADLCSQCTECLVYQYLSPASAVPLLNIAVMLRDTLPDFLKRVGQFFSSFAHRLFQTRSHVKLVEAAVVFLLQLPALYITSETELLEVVCDWVADKNLSMDSARQHLEMFLPHIYQDGITTASWIDIFEARHLPMVEKRASPPSAPLEFSAPASEDDIDDQSGGGGSSQRALKLHCVLAGMHFLDTPLPETVSINSYRTRVTCTSSGVNPVYIDRDVTQAHYTESWKLDFTFNQVAFIGVGIISQRTMDIPPYNGCGISSNGDLYQAIFRSHDPNENHYASRPVHRLKFASGSKMRCSFRAAAVQEGATEDGFTNCMTCRDTRRHPFDFAHQHAQLTCCIANAAGANSTVTVDVVFATDVTLYPFVVLKRCGDTVTIAERENQFYA